MELARCAQTRLAEATEPEERWQRLCQLLHELAGLRKDDHRAARLQMDRTRHHREETEFEEATYQAEKKQLKDESIAKFKDCLRMDQMREPGEPLAVDDIIKDGINRCIFLARPYMRKDYPAKLHQAVQELNLSRLA